LAALKLRIIQVDFFITLSVILTEQLNNFMFAKVFAGLIFLIIEEPGQIF